MATKLEGGGGGQGLSGQATLKKIFCGFPYGYICADALYCRERGRGKTDSKIGRGKNCNKIVFLWAKGYLKVYINLCLKAAKIG